MKVKKTTSRRKKSVSLSDSWTHSEKKLLKDWIFKNELVNTGKKLKVVIDGKTVRGMPVFKPKHSLPDRLVRKFKQIEDSNK